VNFDFPTFGTAPDKLDLKHVYHSHLTAF
jgi:hypothetical protein